MPSKESKKKKPQLPACGYIIAYLRLSDRVLSALRDEARSRLYVPVFKDVGAKEDDKFRSQARVTQSSAAVNAVKLALLEVTACLDPAWRPRVFSFLYSRPGGTEQEAHQDYSPRDVSGPARCDDSRVPASMLLALESETCLRVYNGCLETRDDSKARIIKIPVGFCVIFRGDLIHNGMAYSADNFRLHCYLNYPRVSWTPDLVSSVLPKTHDCQYCS